MRGDRGDEDDRRPVMDLAHHEPRAHLVGDPQNRRVGGGHHVAPQRRVGAVVDDLLRRRDVEEGEERPREHEDDEAVHGDLAEHERPVIRERLAERATRERRRGETVVEPFHDPAHHHGRSQKPGPTGSR